MPRWDFECDKCGAVQKDVVGVKCDPSQYAPLCCGQPMFNNVGASRQSAQVFESYVTTHIHPDGKPLTVRNSGDLKRFETEFGVKRVDDPGLVSRNGQFVRDKASKGRVYI